MCSKYVVKGGRTLAGTVFVQGAKNGVLAMMSAALLATDRPTILRNVPAIDDVRQAVKLLGHVGAMVEFHESERTLIIDVTTVGSGHLPAGITRTFRGSVLFVPTVLQRVGKVTYGGAGGCDLGTRGLDFHYRGFARLGAAVEDLGGAIVLRAGTMRGAELYLDTPSHTGTENLVLAAVLTPGTTDIENAAVDPEVASLARMLTQMGANITGIGTPRLTIEGVPSLHAVESTVIPDRMDAGLFVAAAAMTGSRISLVGADTDTLGVARFKLAQMGIRLENHGA